MFASVISLLFVTVAIVVWRPVECRVAGVTLRVPFGSTVQEALAAAGVERDHGDLLTVRGEVLKKGGGLPPVVLREGRALPLEARVLRRDVLTVLPARDVCEPVREETSLLEPGRHDGYAEPAVTGTRRLQVGLLSGAATVATVSALPTVAAAAPAPKRKLVALTFDDGPWSKYTGQILEILREHDARATFFVLGSLAQGRPDVIRRMAAEGHEVAVHSWRHANLTRLSSSAVVGDLSRCRNTIQGLTGKPVRLVRPPYGALNSTARAAIAQTGLRPVLWTADTHDWRNPGSSAIASRIMKGARSGAIILCHDGGGSRAGTVAAIARVVPALQKAGYELATVSEVLGLQPRPEGGALILADGRKMEVKPVQPELGLVVDGEAAAMSEAPVEVEGQLLLPARPTLDLLGLKWAWDQQAQTLTLAGPFERYVVRVNSLQIETGPGMSETLPAPPILYRNHLMVPLWVALKAAQGRAAHDPLRHVLHLTSFEKSISEAFAGHHAPEEWGRGAAWREYLGK